MIHISDKEHKTIRIDFYEYLDLRQIGELFSSGHESSFQIGISNTILRYKHVGSRGGQTMANSRQTKGK